MKEIGIYIHIPFCIKKCAYCDFISFSDKNELIEKYIETLKKEISETLANKNLLAKTIYIGGGTPSSIDSKHIEEILNCVKNNIAIDKSAEITIEINPGTVDREKLKSYFDMGINRISIGLQETNNEILKLIGRIHTYEDFLDTYNDAKKVGFNNINIDLMFALPNQNLEHIEKSLEKIIKLKPNHISTYSLILEEGTKLYENRKELILPDEETERNMYWYIKNTLESNGYKHYEISNFSLEGWESKHNLDCWNQKEYIGLGLSAHSYLNGIRYSNTNNINQYISENKKIIHENQTKQEMQKEYMLLGLRKIVGINISEFKNKFGENPIYLYRKELNKLVEENLIEIEGDIIKLTNKGLDLANIVWEEFI